MDTDTKLDVIVRNHGTIWTIEPVSIEALDWTEQHVEGMLGDGLVVVGV